jgi:phosphoenolpyruvate synthase (EC 2.7.9.2)
VIQPDVVWFDEVGIADVPQVGGKNASLGEMHQFLASAGVKVPDGFATTASAYRRFVQVNGLAPKVKDRIDRYHSGASSLAETGAALRRMFLDSTFPQEMVDGIVAFYRNSPRNPGEEPRGGRAQQRDR